MAQDAVARVIEAYGGLTQATVKTGVGTSTWIRWRKQGWIDDARVLVDAASATGIDPRDLAPPDRHSA